MSSNITYLLGAGASANCLPIIDSLPSRLIIFKEILEERIDENTVNSRRFSNPNVIAKAAQLVTEIELIIGDLRKHMTIDTLAKKYFLTKNRTYLKILKQVLIVYFLFEQTYDCPSRFEKKTLKRRQVPDKRYDSLIATILQERDNTLVLPSNLHIITWNYDTQFEYACSEYFTDTPISNVQEMIQAAPTLTHINNKINSKKNIIDLNKFCLVRLNGIAHVNGKVKLFSTFPVTETQEILDADMDENTYLASIIEYYATIKEPTQELFKYAWEEQESLYLEDKEYDLLENEIILSTKDLAKKIMNRTEILVVIGYSFPLFNRSVDKELLEDCPNLKKIYIQDIQADRVKSLMFSSFPTLREMSGGSDSMLGNISMRMGHSYPQPYLNIEIEIVDTVDQFFIPPEADI